MSMKHYEQAVELIKSRGLGSQFVGPKSEEVVARAEAALGIRFPPTYRRFCLEYGAGWIYAGVLEPKDLALACVRDHYVGEYHKPGQPPKPGTPYGTLDVVETTLRFLKRKSIAEVPTIDMWSHGQRSVKHVLVRAWLIMFAGHHGLVVKDETGKSEATCYYVRQAKKGQKEYPDCHDDPSQGDFGRFFLRGLSHLDD
jgi:hypothetical protein